MVKVRLPVWVRVKVRARPRPHPPPSPIPAASPSTISFFGWVFSLWIHYLPDYGEALKQGGASLYAHMNLGILYYSRGETVDAVNEFERVVELLRDRSPEMFGASEAEARFRLAQAHVKLGHHAEAIEQLEVAEKRGGEGQWGRKSGEYLAVLR